MRCGALPPSVLRLSITDADLVLSRLCARGRKFRLWGGGQEPPAQAELVTILAWFGLIWLDFRVKMSTILRGREHETWAPHVRGD